MRSTWRRRCAWRGRSQASEAEAKPYACDLWNSGGLVTGQQRIGHRGFSMQRGGPGQNVRCASNGLALGYVGGFATRFACWSSLVVVFVAKTTIVLPAALSICVPSTISTSFGCLSDSTTCFHCFLPMNTL